MTFDVKLAKKAVNMAVEFYRLKCNISCSLYNTTKLIFVLIKRFIKNHA